MQSPRNSRAAIVPQFAATASVRDFPYAQRGEQAAANHTQQFRSLR
jgi:hypothetical protein